MSRIVADEGAAIDDSNELQLSELPGIREPEGFGMIKSELSRPNRLQIPQQANLV